MRKSIYIFICRKMVSTKTVYKFSATILFFGVKSLSLNAQVVTNSQIWYSYQLNADISDKWGIWFDANYRSQSVFFTNNFQDALRVGMIRKIKPGQSITLGYAFFRHYRPRTGADEILPENRIWTQYAKSIQQGNLQFSHRLRGELRSIKRGPGLATKNDAYQTFGRLRYQFQTRMNLNTKHSSLLPGWLILSEEIMLHGGESIDMHFFDQNRLQALFEWKVANALFFQAGYMHLIQYQPVQERWRQSHVIRLNVRHQPKLYKQSKQH
jgi:hypothetical protein